MLQVFCVACFFCKSITEKVCLEGFEGGERWLSIVGEEEERFMLAGATIKSCNSNGKLYWGCYKQCPQLSALILCWLSGCSLLKVLLSAVLLPNRDRTGSCNMLDSGDDSRCLRARNVSSVTCKMADCCTIPEAVALCCGNRISALLGM